MSDFETVEFDLGPCDCPGTPHGVDRATRKVHLLYGDKRRIAAAMASQSVEGDTLGLAQVVLFTRALVSWTKTDERGNRLPITIETIDNLSVEQGTALIRNIDTYAYSVQLGFAVPPPPNAFGEPSQDGLAAPAASSPSAETTSPSESEPISSTSS